MIYGSFTRDLGYSEIGVLLNHIQIFRIEQKTELRFSVFHLYKAVDISGSSESHTLGPRLFTVIVVETLYR